MNEFKLWLSRRYKSLVAASGGIVLFLQGIVEQHPNKWISAAIILLMIVGVHQVNNAP